MYVTFTNEILNNLKPNLASIRFVTSFLRLSKHKRTRIRFTEFELKQWLFPIALSRPCETSDLINIYIKYKNKYPKVFEVNNDT